MHLHLFGSGVRRLLPLLALALVCLAASAASGAATREGTAGGLPAIDPALRQELAASTDGRVAAVVTAWDARGLARIERLGIRGTKLTRLPMILVPALSRAQLERLSRSPDVRSVYANAAHALTMEDTTWITRARYVWGGAGGALPGLGVTGAGVHVAVIDTGADGMHEDMDNLVEFCEATQAATSTHASVLCSPFDPESGNAGPAGPTNTARGDATDDDGHGTHVIGTIAGSGAASGGRSNPHSTIGLSPDAKVHAYSANVGPSLLSHEILASYDDIVNKKLLGLSEVVAVSNSWGGGDGADYSPADPMHVAFKAAYDAGILSIFAAGNSGPEHNTLSRQCVSPWVVCVAASTKPDHVVAFSSKGRPSEPADTNRDGVVGGAGDVQPGNHDRALGQALDLGLYRPALSAPGVNINSMSANSPACRELGATGDPATASTRACYESLNGTSMATPHVTGAVPLIVQAYRAANGGRTPSPAVITDILERSAAANELPGWEAEEQGAGRLDVYTAVQLAQSASRDLPPLTLGTPTPPGLTASTVNAKGCTGTGSWSVGTVESPLDPVGQPPLSTQRYAEHRLQVAERTERLRITMDWPRHATANLYARLWRPGVNPSAEGGPGRPARVMADQEAVGLLGPGNSVVTRRLIEVRAPEAGEWVLRVYHRAGGLPLLCDADSSERPKVLEGFNYALKIERHTTSAAPSVAIGSPADGGTVSGDSTSVSGSASYPAPWPGVTNWEVRGSGNPAIKPEPDAPDDRLVLHFQGNVEEGCTGVGTADLDACDGPFLREDSSLSASNAATWTIPAAIFHGTADRSPYDPSWVWRLDGPTTLSGDMTIEWWASCPGCAGSLGLAADWWIRLWADGVEVFEQRVTASLASPGVAEKLETTVSVPSTTASSTFVLHVDPVYVDAMNGTTIYYDSQAPCPTAGSRDPCDSLVRMPVSTGGEAGGPAPPGDPANVRVTDLHGSLGVAWDATAGAASYEVYRSDVPWTVGKRVGKTSSTSYTDRSAKSEQTHYYRVVALDSSGRRSLSSEAASGTRTQYDRQVRVKVDRVYGPQYWEIATLGSAAGTSWSLPWHTLELAAGEHAVSARSFTQGQGSARASIRVSLAR